MIEPLLFFVAMAMAQDVAPASAAPAPAAPAAAATAGPATPQTLREIGRVHVSPACTSIVVRANSAIGTALRNDQTMSLAIQALRRVKLDGSDLDRMKGIREIDKLAADLRTSAGAADGQIIKLREMAADATDADRKEELRSFADALGGALYRQRRAAADIQRFLTIVEGREARAETMTAVTRTSPELKYAFAAGNDFFDAKHFAEMAKSAADDMEERVQLINGDESKAAEHVGGAVSGC